MAQNLTIAGAAYTAVPAVNLPKTGGGTATFVDTSDATATAAQMLFGATGYSGGTKKTGTIPTYSGGNTITSNGTVSCAGKYMASDLTVNVSGGGGSEKLASLISNSGSVEITADDLSGITKIRNYAFNYCTSLVSIEIPYGVTEIGIQAFQTCTALTTISIPDTVTSIGTSAFNVCRSLTSITIPNGVQLISNSMLYNCKAITSITLGNNVTEIETYAFRYATNLTTLRCYTATPPSLAYYGLADIPTTCKIYVPSASLAAYKAATNWSARASQIYAM